MPSRRKVKEPVLEDREIQKQVLKQLRKYAKLNLREHFAMFL